MPFTVNNLLKDSQVQLERATVDTFGAAVEDFAKGIGKPKGGGTPPPPNRNETGSWYSSSYAAALAGATDLRPKMKFLFKVEFIFTDAAKKAYPAVFDSKSTNDFTFMIKTVERPKVDFEYDEDVNMYNFRTKVLKKIIHRDLTMTFMDDVGNRVFDFFRTLMAIHSPITRGQFERDNTLEAPRGDSVLNGSGMSWLSKGAGVNNAHRAVVNSTFGNSIACIRVKQIFVNPTVGLSDASQMVTFDFVNPRIVSFDLDEVSHEANDVNLLTMVFGYDWMEMVKVGSLSAQGENYTKTNYQFRAKGVSGAPEDIVPAPGGKAASPGGGGLFGKFGGVLDKQFDKATKQITSDLIGRGVRAVAGNNRLAQALGGQLTSYLSGPISGLVTGASRERLGGLFSSTVSPFGRAGGSTIRDGSVAGGVSPASVVSSSDAYATTAPVTGDGSLNS